MSIASDWTMASDPASFNPPPPEDRPFGWDSTIGGDGAHHEDDAHHEGDARHEGDAHHDEGDDAQHAGGDGGDAKKPKVTYPSVTASELLRMKIETNWLVDYLLVEKQPCILAGGKKTLKTSIAIDLGISLATAGHFLGVFNVPEPRRVALMSGESGYGAIQETTARIAEAAGVHPDDMDNFIISESLPKIGHLHHTDGLREYIAERELDVLIIDPTYLAMPGDDAGNLFIQGERLRTLNELTAETGCTFILLHHCKRNTGDDKYGMPELEHIAWAGYQEWARQWLLLSRREPYQPGTGEHALWLSAGGSFGHGGGWGLDISEGVRSEGQTRHWTVALTPATAVVEHREQARAKQADAKLEQQHEAARRALVEKAVSLGRQFDRAELLEITLGQRQRKITAWATLVEDGTFTPAGTIKKANNQTYPTYQVATDDNDI